jgi:protein-disulfide isomerase
MASRSAQRRDRADEARKARLAIETAAQRAAALRRRRNGVLAAICAVALVLAVAIATSGGGPTPAATGARVVDAAFSNSLFAGIPQHGLELGSPSAPVRLVEYADLQCPYCGEYATQALPQLVTDYVRTGKVSMEFRNLSFIGPDSVRAGRVAAGAAAQDKLWNFIDLMYLNQGVENTGYATASYLRGLLAAIPGLDVAAAFRASRTPAAGAELSAANADASAHGINSTPSFLIGPAGGTLRLFQPASLTAGAFVAEFNGLLAASGR